MPSYDYECRTCGTFTEFRAMADRDRAAACTICDGPAQRAISAPNLALMNPLSRMAATRNERSQHEPRVGMKSGCCSGGTCATHKKNAAPKLDKSGRPAARASTKRNRRPWMLGH